MLLDLGDKQYSVHFQYGCVREQVLTGRGFQVKYIPHYETLCTIHEGKCVVKGCANEPRSLNGVAYCHPNDQFSRSKGRKMALSRALDTLPRETRRDIWKAYFKICPIS